jgi:RimJ/RimL family protein N-acetyltransferase
METRENQFGQPIGAPVAGWTPRPHPPAAPLAGRYCRIEPLDPARHGDALFAADQLAADARDWTYLVGDRPAGRAAFQAWLESCAAPWAAAAGDPLFHAILLADGRAAGLAAYLRIDRGNGVIEVGHILFTPALQRRPAGTEAIFLLMRRAFDELGYRRFEWKCDHLNAPSRRAALRYGFRFEGIFRQAVVYKGRNRDTAWFAITDQEWPMLRAAFEAWLDPANFTPNGAQRRPLAAFHAPAGSAETRPTGP